MYGRRGASPKPTRFRPRLPQALTSKYAAIPWRRMRGLRNILPHEYFGVDPQIIWQTVTEDLPPLLLLLQDIVDRSPQIDED